jgi:hypothetical protein
MVTAKTSLVSVGINARMVTRILAPYANLRVVRVSRKPLWTVSIVDPIRMGKVTGKIFSVCVGIDVRVVIRIEVLYANLKVV